MKSLENEVVFVIHEHGKAITPGGKVATGERL